MGAAAVIAIGMCLFVIGWVLHQFDDVLVARGLIRKPSWLGAVAALCVFFGIGLGTAGAAVMAWRLLP